MNKKEFQAGPVSVLEDLTEEQFGSIVLRIIEKIVRVICFDDFSAIHKDHSVCYSSGKSHLMGHNKHRHSTLCQLNHHVQDLLDHLRVQCGSWFIK